jgi:pyruvate dehydrogenase E1 component beta subunit
MDYETVLASARKTGQCAVIVQSPQTCSIAEHVAFEIQRNAFGALKQPVEIISARAVPPPMAAPLELDNIPSVQRIADTVLKLLKG